MSAQAQPVAPAATAPSDDGFDILDAAHSQAIVELGKLAALVSRIRTHGIDDVARALAVEVAGFFGAYNREHHADEEKHVFPQLLRDGDAETVQTVRCLLQDHRWLDEDWREVGALVQAIASGQGWIDVDTLHEGVQVFSGLMRAHIALEESFIYPQARARSNSDLRHEMAREISARRRDTRKNGGAKGGLDAAQTAWLRKQLLEREAALKEFVRQSVAPMSTGTEVVDQKDLAERGESQSLAEALDRLEREELKNVQAALRRMDAGVYGLCTDCDRPILLTRLLAHPDGLRCATCQDRFEVLRSRRGVRQP
ncbi:MAG: hemerythrin domain-containing protein [Paucibacter sp.]|nr:hemerythrin domain-containing protein [Roseateles sp.]